MKDFVKYDLETGVFRGFGACAEDQVQYQAEPGMGVIALGRSALVADDNSLAMTIDLAPVVEALLLQVDTQAGAIRSQFITDVPGQAQTYERKEREARAWTEGAAEADFPFLATEASVRGVDIAQVQAEVMAQVNALTPLAALIEAHRMAAKIGIGSATTFAEALTASMVDWADVIGG